MTNVGINNLRYAIVEKAANDYVLLRSGCLLPTARCNEKELLYFFHSQWYEFLCDIPAEAIIKGLNKRAAIMAKPLKYNVARSKKKKSKWCVCEWKTKKIVPNTWKNSKLEAKTLAAKLNNLTLKDFNSVRNRDEVKDDYV